MFSEKDRSELIKRRSSRSKKTDSPKRKAAGKFVMARHWPDCT